MAPEQGMIGGAGWGQLPSRTRSHSKNCLLFFLAVEQAGIVALSLADLPPCSFNDGHCIFALHGVQELIVSNHAFQAS